MGGFPLHTFGPGIASAKKSAAKELHRVENCFIALEDNIYNENIKVEKLDIGKMANWHCKFISKDIRKYIPKDIRNYVPKDMHEYILEDIRRYISKDIH